MLDALRCAFESHQKAEASPHSIPSLATFLYPQQYLATGDRPARQTRIHDARRLQVLHQIEDQAIAAFRRCTQETAGWVSKEQVFVVPTENIGGGEGRGELSRWLTQYVHRHRQEFCVLGYR